MSNDKIKSISGIVKRVGYANDIGQAVHIQFMLENDKTLYHANSKGNLGLLTIGDQISFELKKSILGSYYLDIYSFKNLSLEKDLMQ